MDNEYPFVVPKTVLRNSNVYVADGVLEVVEITPEVALILTPLAPPPVTIVYDCPLTIAPFVEEPFNTVDALE